MRGLTAQLLKIGFDIVRLRSGPQDLPSGPTALQISIVLFVVSYVVAVSQLFPLGESLLRAGLDLVLSALFIQLLLRIRRLPARFGQTFSAICLTGFILNTLAWPLFAALSQREGADPSSGSEVLALLFWLLYGWSLVVAAHIYRHALDILFAAGFLLALGYFMLAFTVGEALLGGAR